MRHGVTYAFTLHAETLAIGLAKIPVPEEEGPVDDRGEHVIAHKVARKRVVCPACLAAIKSETRR